MDNNELGCSAEADGLPMNGAEQVVSAVPVGIPSADDAFGVKLRRLVEDARYVMDCRDVRDDLDNVLCNLDAELADEDFSTPDAALQADALRSNPFYNEDQAEQLAFELAWELEEADLSAGDYVKVNQAKLRAIAERVLTRLSAQAMETQRAETVGLGAEHDSAVLKGCAQSPSGDHLP